VLEDQGFAFLSIESVDQLMMISSFFDESGKFKDQSTISFAGVAGTAGDMNAFGAEWLRHLRLNGLKALTMKDALNSRRALSAKRPALGVANRLDALMPFVECIRKYVQGVVGVAVDVGAFKKTPDHLRQTWGDDPHFMAFAGTLLEVMKPLKTKDNLNIICDDEEKVALPMYKLYRRVKLVYTDTKGYLASLSFADDEVFYGL
jgi:hypothetical protein